jgi:hypothetical protein
MNDATTTNDASGFTAGSIVQEITRRASELVDLSQVDADDLMRSLIGGGLAADELARRMDRNGFTGDAEELRRLADRLRGEASEELTGRG